MRVPRGFVVRQVDGKGLPCRCLCGMIWVFKEMISLRKLFLTLLMVCLAAFASAESVVDMPYTLVTEETAVVGTYTGEWENDRPNGYGVFTVLSETA